jgi:hypothetical protein
MTSQVTLRFRLANHVHVLRQALLFVRNHKLPRWIKGPALRRRNLELGDPGRGSAINRNRYLARLLWEASMGRGCYQLEVSIF